MKSSPQSPKFTPLGIVAAFVTLTEAVLGYAVTQVQGGVQVALAVFVIAFAILVAGAFFAILWFKAYVFYPPSEYGDTDPARFIDAMKGQVPDRVAEQIKMVENFEQSPDNSEVTFRLIDSLIEESIRQHLILMREKNFALKLERSFGEHKFELARDDGYFQFGGISAREIAEKLKGTDLVHIDARDIAVHLTEMGQKFSDWLIRTNRKVSYLRTFFGGWGERNLPAGIPPGFLSQLNEREPAPSLDDIQRAFAPETINAAQIDAQPDAQHEIQPSG